MKINNFKKKIFFACILVLSFFVPRYFAHLQYDALEDEILAIGNNLMYPISSLFLAPDFTHPPLWYVLMDYPTEILGLEHGIFYYRLIQMLVLFFIVIFTLIYFQKKLPKRFLFTFFTLFLSNVYLVHLTSQHRMYAMVLGVAVFYSFYWYYLIKNKVDRSFKHFLLLGLIAALGFFINYSIVWLLPIWPLSYLFYKKTQHSLKSFFIFSTTFLLSISWFLPFFVKNVNKSIAVNQWAPQLNILNVFMMIENYFGFSSMLKDFYKLNVLFYPFIFLFLVLIFLRIKNSQLNYSKIIFAFTLLFLIIFILVVNFTGNSLLYSRTSITLVVAFYILIADSVANKRCSKLIFSALIILQVVNFFFYFNQSKDFSKNYSFFNNYRHNPIKSFQKYPFVEDSCLISVPNWNAMINNFFLGKNVKVIASNKMTNDEIMNEAGKCSLVYILEQNTVNREDIDRYYQLILRNNFTLKLMDSFDNQDLYILEKK